MKITNTGQEGFFSAPGLPGWFHPPPDSRIRKVLLPFATGALCDIFSKLLCFTGQGSGMLPKRRILDPKPRKVEG